MGWLVGSGEGSVVGSGVGRMLGTGDGNGVVGTGVVGFGVGTSVGVGVGFDGPLQQVGDEGRGTDVLRRPLAQARRTPRIGRRACPLTVLCRR